MASGPTESLNRPALVVVAGMLLPVLPVAVAEDVLHNAHHPLVPLPVVGAVEYGTFLLGLGVLYVVISWGIIQRGALDRVSFLLATLVVPWMVVIVGLFTVLLVAGKTWGHHPMADVFNQLTGGGQIIAYGTPYFFGGLAAYALSRLTDRYINDSTVTSDAPG